MAGYCILAKVSLNDLKLAAASYQANIIVLSLSFTFSARRARPVLRNLRHILPEDVEIWAGGKGADVIRHPKNGLRILLNFEEAITLLQKFDKHKKQT